MSGDTVQTQEQLPLPLTIPTQVSADGNSVEASFTESDPVGPQKPQSDDSTLIAGKFKSVEDLEKAYKELETKMGSQTKEQPAEGEGEQPQNKEVVPDNEKVASVEINDEASALLKEKGLDISSFSVEYERTGQLSPESYAKLNAAGITTEMVNDYINGNRALVTAQVTDVKNSIGGEAEYGKMLEWAGANLSTAEREAYDRVMATNDLDFIKFAAAGLHAKFKAAMGKDPAVVVGGSAPGGNDGVGRFASRAEMVRAMSKEEYQTDPAYRAKVERMVLNSNI